MKTLLFANGLLLPVLAGGKKITIRKYDPERHHFAKDELFVGSFKDGLNIVLVATDETKVITFAELSPEEARKDGFVSTRWAFREMKKYYPDLEMTDLIGLIYFEVPRYPNGGDVPTVEYNEFASFTTDSAIPGTKQ